MKVYIAKDWRGSGVFSEPPILMKCGGMPDIWSGHKLPFDITGSFVEDKIPKGQYIERDIWWSVVNKLKYSKMKPSKSQIELMEFCKSIINTWINTNDINSPTHESDLHDFINADLDWLSDEDREDIENFMLNLYKFIKYDIN